MDASKPEAGSKRGPRRAWAWRAAWTAFGLVLSVPAFLPPLLRAMVALGIVVSTVDVSTVAAFHLLWRHPMARPMFWAGGLYAVYWGSIGWLMVQFVWGCELSAVALSAAAVIAISALAALQPWQPTQELFSLGPASLWHLGFMASVIAWSAWSTRSGSTRPAGPAP